MNFITSLTFATIALFNQNLFARSPVEMKGQQKIKPCLEAPLATMEPNRELSACSTKGKDGFLNIFKRVKINGKLGIQDLGIDGKIWFDEIVGGGDLGISQNEAIEICKENGHRLPAKSDIELVEKRGFRSAFTYDLTNYPLHLWSSNVEKNLMYYYWTGNGDVYHTDYDPGVVGAICIAGN